MKTLKIILIFALCFIYGCGSEKDTVASTPYLSIDKNTIDAEYCMSVETVNVSAIQEWTAFSDCEWISCKTNGSDKKKGTIEITIDENRTFNKRQGNITVKCGKEKKLIVVIQEAHPEMDTDGIDVPQGYRLVWNDEFETGDQPNESVWFYETGGSGWGNNELQTYIAGSKDGIRCAEINDGTLKITARKVGNDIYSIRMNSRESWLYGYFEARMKLPAGKGTWPAFWMLPENFNKWPDDGEIDIMEEVGYDPNVIYATIHCKAYNHAANTQKSGQKTVPTAQDGFHVYAVEWTEDFIKGYVDGQCYFIFDNDKQGNKDTWPFNVPFYLKLNLAWGGNWGGAQGIDESMLPATFEIDYVRVFQKK